ncbi:cytochrome c oxidase assembly protein COX11, mitochondrial [Strongylocentrotus purpuratus]|uniref:Cytochrome c oxidase assembly protein COX11, mitochondrial n=1 Tax=Strongylocentrotus purpuratus TaxID=7668 RepID=A0A7M7HM22_STRPU|nr:cytochrome c oxidase assembly protein COX11, mitochondrial [Strongylocentrotus purpuratus]
MMQVSSAHLLGLARTASSVSVPLQRGILHNNLLQRITSLKSDHLFHSTSAMRNPLHRSHISLFKAMTSHQGCVRTSQSALKPSSHFGQGCRLAHTSKPLGCMSTTSRLSRPNEGQYLFRNCPLYATRGLCVAEPVRFNSSQSRSQTRSAWRERNKSVMLYVVAGAVLVVGFSYAAVPLYTVFCQATGLGGQATAGHDTEKVETMAPVRGRELVIRFNADTAASMRWNFRPQQSEVKLVPGETALAFYSAMNPTDKPIVGISTYNVVPFDAGQYFNKIQCFCFEEQRLNPHEQVDMPVFFYIDPDFDEDPKMAKVNNITLSYTFFESKEGLELPDPWSRPE